MIVFSCEFPLDQTKSDDDIVNVLTNWITGSPNYPWGPSAVIARPSEHEPITEISKDGHRLWLVKIKTDTAVLCGIRYAFTEDNKYEWTTEISSSHKDDRLWITVKIFCDLVTAGGVIPNVKKPYVIGLLLKHLNGGNDGIFKVSETPTHLSSSDIATATAIVNGTINCSMPIVYLSCDMNGRQTIDPITLGRWLSGIAHVVVEPDRRFSIRLAKEVGNTNCYGGAAGVYWPNGGGRSIKIRPWNFPSSTDAASEIARIVRGSLLYSKTKNGVTWLNIKDILAAKRVADLKVQSGSELKEYISAFDDQIDTLRQQLDQALSHNASLQAALQSANSKLSRVNSGLIQPGKEAEFYPGEIADAIVSALLKARAMLGEEGRHRMLINDVLDANKMSENGAKIEASIKSALVGTMKITQREIKILEGVGFTITDGGKHYRAIFNDDPRFHFTLFNTASDHRSGQNMASTMISKLLIK